MGRICNCICNCLQGHALGTPSEETRSESIVEVESAVMAEEVMDVWMGIESICVVSARIHRSIRWQQKLRKSARPTVLFTSTRSRFPILVPASFQQYYLLKTGIYEVPRRLFLSCRNPLKGEKKNITNFNSPFYI